MKKFENKIILITGIGGPKNTFSNGKAIAKLFASNGGKVEGTDKNLELGSNTVKLIKNEGNYCNLTIFDATDEKLVKKWVNNCIKKHKKIDILINNVGQSEPFDPLSSSTELWNNQFKLNISSAFYTTKSVLPHMIKQKNGVIINISSIAGIRFIGKPQVAYSSAKAALIQFTKTSAILHAKNNIRMNCIIPGFINTPLVEKLAQKYSDGNYEKYKKQRDNIVPLGKMGSPHDIAKATLFLSSDDAKYITATELIVDGGLSATISN